MYRFRRFPSPRAPQKRYLTPFPDKSLGSFPLFSIFFHFPRLFPPCQVHLVILCHNRSRLPALPCDNQDRLP